MLLFCRVGGSSTLGNLILLFIGLTTFSKFQVRNLKIAGFTFTWNDFWKFDIRYVPAIRNLSYLAKIRYIPTWSSIREKSCKIFWSFYQIETKIMKSSERRKLWLQWGQNQDANTFSSVCAQRAAACFEILVISSETRTKRPSQPPSFSLDTVQDFLIKLGIKPRMHFWK